MSGAAQLFENVENAAFRGLSANLRLPGYTYTELFLFIVECSFNKNKIL